MENYQCNLSEQDREKAKRELHEDPSNAGGAAEELRRWVLQDASHLTCPTDTPFLLKFLRNAKFSQLVAREKLEAYYRKYSLYKHCFTDVHDWDTTDPRMQAIWRSHCMVALPRRTPAGEAVVVFQHGLLCAAISNKTVSFKPTDMYKAGIMTMEMLLMDEGVQVNGVQFIDDMTGTKLCMMTWMTPDKLKVCGKVFEKGLPVRIRQMNSYNGGVLFDTFNVIISAFMSDKIKKRIRNHGNQLQTVYDNIPKHCLPQEYLPDEYTGPHVGTMADCAEKHVSKMASPEVRRHIRELTNRKFGINEKNKIESETASFRKLNID